MRYRRPLLPSSVVAIAAGSLLAAGCGGGGGSPTTAASAAQNRVLPFIHCMRSHGVPNFPGPNSSGVFPKETPQQLGVSISQFRVAGGACAYLSPKRPRSPEETAQEIRTRLADALSFARCMRGRGVTSFPDPDARGDLSVEMVQAQGIDVHSPAVLQVVNACLPASHGALTPAKVREALQNAGG